MLTESTKTRLENRLLAGLERAWGNELLTVLAYHRIRTPSGFPFFEPVISATPDDFALQMDVVAERYNPITLGDLHSWQNGTGTLPPRAILVTFDDGYRDNLEFALPILEERGLPAVLFLPTEFIGRDRPFFWDAAAYCFNRTERTQADLPIMGHHAWTSPASISSEWIEAAKWRPAEERGELVERLGAALDVVMPEDVYESELLSWDEVRTMAGRGFSFGSHTLSHPILTRLSPEHAVRELTESRMRLEEELDMPIRSLAYPNGTPTDFGPRIQEMAHAAGYEVAFTLVPGPARYREVAADPLAVRRVSLYLDDGPRRFRAKLAGGGRVKSSLS